MTICCCSTAARESFLHGRLRGPPPEMARREMNEEVRLFYVAATRARETLTLFYPAESDKGLVPPGFCMPF